MRITIKETRFVRGDLRGMPYQVHCSFWLGAQRQHGYEWDGLLANDGPREPSPVEFARLREQMLAGVQRKKVIRKIAKRIPIEFHVEPA